MRSISFGEEKSDDDSVVLVTGAAGYVGSHVCLELLLSGHRVVGLDNLRTGSIAAINAVEELSGHKFQAMYIADVCDEGQVDECIAREGVTDVVHLAGLKAVSESVSDPLVYFNTNVCGSGVLLAAMERNAVERIVFSSSCTVYGDPSPDLVPLDESSPTQPANPYGRSKLSVEELLTDVCATSDSFAAISLRYFNPIGAHESGKIGDDQPGTPNNLLPYLMQVALGQRDELTVFGGDYATADGTCVRDYIHVVDVAKAHVAAIAALRPGHEVINLATGTGSTVLEIIDAASHAVGRELPYRIGERRAGDAAVVIADAAHSAERLGWKAERSLQTMCDDHWRWQSTHPDGYPSASLAADRVVSLLPIDLREDDSVTRPANAFDRNVVDTRGA